MEMYTVLSAVVVPMHFAVQLEMTRHSLLVIPVAVFRKLMMVDLTWRNVSDGIFKVGSIGDIAVSESDPNVVYVGTRRNMLYRGVMTSMVMVFTNQLMVEKHGRILACKIPVIFLMLLFIPIT